VRVGTGLCAVAQVCARYNPRLAAAILLRSGTATAFDSKLFSMTRANIVSVTSPGPS
jgi:hypothetical protein